MKLILKNSIFALTVLSLTSFGHIAWADTELGKLYYEAGKFERAFKEFNESAKKGEAEAQYYLGSFYQFGRYVTKDSTEAAKWYRLAADQGHATAQYNLGFMYLKGLGVPQSNAEVLMWWLLAAEQGVTIAKFNIGILYIKGQGVEKNEAKGVKWIHLAAEEGLAEAQSRLGNMYDNGLGVPVDYAESAKWYLKAAGQGDKAAQLNIGSKYHHGHGVTKNHIQAMKWYALSYLQGNEVVGLLISVLAKKMTEKEIAEAERLAQECLDASSTERNRKGIITMGVEANFLAGEKLVPHVGCPNVNQTASVQPELPIAEEDYWTTENDNILGVLASVNGEVVWGDRYRIILRDNTCKVGQHYFTILTYVQNEEILGFGGKVIPITYNGQEMNAEVIAVNKYLSLGYHLMFFLGTMDLDAFPEFVKNKNHIEIEFLDDENFKASDYFDVPTERWALVGVQEAINEARVLCLNVQELVAE